MSHLPLNTAKQIVGLLFWVPHDETRLDGSWFWRDEFCDEPIGPFDTRAEAAADYRALRHPSEGNSHE